jgi:chromosomal replication initiation ATPase DnaA
MTPTIALLATIAAHFRLSVDEMLSAQSRRTPSLARHVAAYVLRQPPWSRSWQEIADVVRLDKRSVSRAVERIGGLLDVEDARVTAAVAAAVMMRDAAE